MESDTNDILCWGRELKSSQANTVLEAANSGTDGLILVRGAPWIGKTVLLHRIAALASERGFTIMECDLDAKGRRWQELMLSTHRSASTTRIEIASTHQLRRHIEAQTVHGPVLVVGDELHRVGRSTFDTLHLVIERLRDWPVVWALAYQDTVATDVVGRLGGSDERACLLGLEPLCHKAMVELVEEKAGAKPEPELITFAEWAEGNPRLIADLIGGLIAEGGLVIEAGSARLVSARLPRRVVDAVRDRLAELSTGCRQFVTVASAHGKVVALDKMAEMLGETPAMLLPKVEEAIYHGFLVSRDDVVIFASELLWRAVGEGVPRAIFDALRRTAGPLAPSTGVPLARTGSPPAGGELTLRARSVHGDGHGHTVELSDTERELVRMVSLGMTNRQIAQRLTRTEHTVNYHLQKIYRRLNVHSRVELVGLLQRNALL